MDPQATLRLVPSAQNAAILREVRDVLEGTLGAGSCGPADAAAVPGRRGRTRVPRAWPLVWFADGAVASFAWAVLPAGLGRQLLVAVVITAVLAGLTGLNTDRLSWSVVADVPAVAVLAAVGGLALALSGSAGSRSAAGLLFGGVLLSVEILLRSAGYLALRLIRRTGRGSRQVLVLGLGNDAQRLAGALLARRSYGLRPVGFVDLADTPTPPRSVLPLLGDARAIAPAVTRLGVSAAIFAPASQPDAAAAAALRRCLCQRLDVYTVPRLLDLPRWCRAGRIEWVGGVALLRLRGAPPPSVRQVT